jgi:3-hydroxybutyrate dehydrogenase
VSNAGLQHIDSIVDLSFQNWRKIISVHLDGGFLTTRACLRHMIRQKRGGSIILMGSVHSKDASPQKGPYVAAKHGLAGLCRVVAKEGAPHGIRSNLICPGFVRTPLVERQIPQLSKELNISEEAVVKDVMLRNTVDGEFATVGDIARVALFVAAFPTNALTGQSITVSHGWHMA